VRERSLCRFADRKFAFLESSDWVLRDYVPQLACSLSLCLSVRRFINWKWECDKQRLESRPPRCRGHGMGKKSWNAHCNQKWNVVKATNDCPIAILLSYRASLSPSPMFVDFMLGIMILWFTTCFNAITIPHSREESERGKEYRRVVGNKQQYKAHKSICVISMLTWNCENGNKR
jgi:hypothetical protein